ncbi:MULTISPECIES: hypothetical protein [unclassified Streptomyces]|uniref:hypothetical protein n=1 Tax=unclassified Streptomyces TaxID=2593676 RepID=UPI002784F22C|nr:hypothetical protein [Streptomyces sp. B4I13]MDQ0961950.1 DNA-binding transcriptional regulator YdaS (Cro superfamily) [Streptomyces sp. B4I13]
MTDLTAVATWAAGVDFVAVDRVLGGTLSPKELRPEELRYAAKTSQASARSVARLLGVSEKTVADWREA